MADESKELQFKPTASARRKKQDVPDQKEDKKPKPKQPRTRQKRQEPTVTASGPFALGPAERGSRISVSAPTTSTVISIEKSAEMLVDDQPSSADEAEYDIWDPQVATTIPTIQNHIFRNQYSKFMFLQFPNSLPLVDQVKVEQSSISNLIDSQNSIKVAPETLTELPSGEVGEYVVYQSGRMVIRFGDIEFDVSECPASGVGSQIVHIDEDVMELTVLGSIEEKLIVTPNVESLLE